MLWTEKYRPKTLHEYVFVDNKQAEQIVEMVVQKEIPHLMLSGSPGVGKTTLAKVLLNELGVEPGDVLEINASATRGIEFMRTQIDGFARTMPLGDFKYILLDESDMLTKDAQYPLRNMMERYHEMTRFILTCNYPDKIEDAVKSRCVHFHIKKTDRNMFKDRAINILKQENIKFDDDVLETYIASSYPDLRSCIKNLQLNSTDGMLTPPADDVNQEDYIIEAIAYFRMGKYSEGRRKIVNNTRPLASEYAGLYRMLYENLHWWSEDENVQKKLIIYIAEGARWNDQCADPEINFSATLIQMELEI